jgi:hypothetical protein
VNYFENVGDSIFFVPSNTYLDVEKHDVYNNVHEKLDKGIV